MGREVGRHRRRRAVLCAILVLGLGTVPLATVPAAKAQTAGGLPPPT